MHRFFELLIGKQRNKAQRERQQRRRNHFGRIETLEDRRLLAADGTITFDSNTGFVLINGTEQRDSATAEYLFTSVGTFVRFTLISNYGTPNQQQKTLQLNATQVRSEVSENGIRPAIEFQGFGGDDHFSNMTAIASYAHGGPGADTLIGGSALDLFYGGLGSDYLRGMAGDDILYGQDTLLPDDAADIIYGGLGNDQLGGGMGNDWLYGEENDDTLRGDEGNDILNGGGGNDKLLGLAGNDLLYGGTENDELIGGPGADELFGEAGNDTLIGNDRIANLLVDRQVDRLVGGTGIDTFVLAFWWETDRAGNRRKVYEEQPEDKAFYEPTIEYEVPAPRSNYSR